MYKIFVDECWTKFYSIKLLRTGFVCAWPGDASSSVSSLQEIEVDETTHAAASSSAQSIGASSSSNTAPVAQDSVAPLRRRRASMQDALDFTKINASLYERPVSCLSYYYPASIVNFSIPVKALYFWWNSSIISVRIFIAVPTALRREYNMTCINKLSSCYISVLNRFSFLLPSQIHLKKRYFRNLSCFGTTVHAQEWYKSLAL